MDHEAIQEESLQLPDDERSSPHFRELTETGAPQDGEDFFNLVLPGNEKQQSIFESKKLRKNQLLLQPSQLRSQRLSD